MKRILFTWLCCLVSMAMSGQKTVQRLEIETKLRSDSYTIVPVAERGVVMFAQDRTPNLLNQSNWTFSHYDTNLNQLWEKDLELSAFSLLEGYDTDGDNVYLLFRRFSSDVYDFFRIDTKAQTLVHLPRQSLRKLDFEDFKVLNGYAFVAGTSKRTPILLHFNLNA